MISLKVVSKRSGDGSQISVNEVFLKEAAIVRVGLSKERVKGMRRVGNDLVITAVSGEVVTVRDFFASFDGNKSDLVLDDEKGGLWLAGFGEGQGELALSYSGIDAIEPLLLQQDFNFGVLPWLVGGGLAAAGVVGGGGGGGGSQMPSVPLTSLAAPADSLPPGRPTVNPTNARTITGTAEPGTTIRVIDNTGKEIGSATVAADGSYVVRPATPPAHGTELRVVAVDPAGNVSPEARTTVDSAAPAVPMVNPTTGNVIAGTAEPGSVVTVTDGRGNIIGSTTAGQDGSYRITPPAQLADRTAINVVATDAVGNASAPATTTVDRTAPAQPVVNPTNGNPITGTAEPGALVTVKDGVGKIIGSATAGPSGAYSVTPTTPPANGASISVVATDPAGNASQPTTATVDAIAPATPKVNPTDGSPITGTAEPGSVITVTDDKGALIGSTTTGTNGVYSFTPAKPPANGVVIKVTASDAAGNTSKPATAIVDGTPPTPTVNLTKGSPITGTSEPDSVVTVSDSKGNVIGSTTTAPDGTYSLIPATPPAHDTVIHVVVKDAAGNVGRPATTTVDSRPPDAPVVSATNGSTVAGTAEANSVVTIKDLAGRLIGSTTADATGKFGITPATPLANGTTLRVTAADAVGNVSPETSATVDSVPPLAPTVDPTHGDPITGRAEPGSVVTVKDLAGNVIGSATTGSNGVYSLTPRKLPTDGAVLRVAATDAAGNTGPETRATVDGLPPARPTVNPTAGSSITGRAEAGSVVTVRDDTGKLIGSATTDASGNYSITPSVPPANGTGLRIVATDPAGNDSPEVKATVDSLPPAAPTLNPSSGRSIAGSAEPGAVVTIRDGAGKLIGSTTADAAGKFSFTPTTPPADGTQISAVATDPAGNASQPATTTIDSSAPIAPVINPTDGSPITGTAEPGSVVTVKDDTGKLIGSTTADTSGKFSITPVASVANGTVITAVATDQAGNTGAPGSTTVDSMAPAKPAVDVTNGSLITGTAEPRAIVTVRDAAGNLVGSAAADANGRYSIKPSAVPPHNTVLRAVATDAAGNTSPEARATVDSDLPAVPQVDPTSGGAITGTAEPGSTVTVKDDTGKLVGSATADANGKFSIKPATPSAHGTALDVTATDAARNTSQPARVAVDGKAPDAPIVNPSNGGTIAGTAEANSVVTIKDDTGRLLGSTTADANGRFSISPATPPANGTTITAVATDAAGNASAPGSTTVDSTPPLKPTVDATNGSLITGTAEPRSIVTIRDGAGNLVGSAAADVNGRYSIKPAAAPSHNTVLRAVATDAAGNTGPEARATVDSDLPSVPKVDPTAGGSITGTAEPGSVVTIKDGAGKLIGSTAADANGKFSIKPATLLAHDTELSVTAADAAGNTSQPASVKVDGKAPDAPTVKPTNGSTITGTAEAGSVVTIKDSAGNLIGSTTADTGGAYRIDPATPPANGTTLEVTATDAAGNTGPRAIATVDGVPPQEPSIDPTNGNLISGIAEPGSVVTVRDGLGNVIGSTTAAASNGAYSIKPAAVLADGTMLRAVATDAAGNASSEAKATVDSVVPLAPTVSPTNGSHVEGTAEAGSVVTVKDDAGNLVGSAITAPNGTYSVTPSTQPAHGAVLHVTATDAAGNTSPEARATVDRTALPPPTVNPTDGSPITGRADPGSVVTVKDDAGKLVGSAVTAPNGTYSITPAVTPAHDTVLHVVATNAAGTASPEATARVDSVAPLEPTIKPSSGSQITGTAEAGAVVKVTDDADRLVGSAIAAPNGTYTIKPSAIPAHGTVLRAVATDAAGNTSPEARAVVDRVLPSAPKIDPTQGGLITGTAERGSVVTVVDDTGRLVGSTTADINGAYSIRPAATLPNGTVLRATATDAAGNASPEGRTTVDSALPAAPTVKPTNGGTIAGTAEPGSTVTVKDKAGNLIGTATADASGNYAVKPAAVPANGTALEVTATDAAGNTGPAATATVDGKAPDAPTIDPTHGDPITGSAEPGSVVTVKDGTGRLIGSATVGTNGAYAVTPVKPLGDGERISVVATDLAGNASAPATATVDGVAPNRPTVEPTNGGTITGTAERGSVVTIKDSAGNTIGSATADANGNYAVKPATPPAHGTTLSVAATDAAGNTGPAATVSVDSSAPAAPTVKPTNGNTITGTAESGSTVTVKDSAGNVIGSATADAAGNYTVRPVTVPVHDAVLEVTARDAAGNTGPAASTKVDGKAPDAPTVAPTHGDVVKGQAEPGAVVTVRDGSGNVLGSATAGANGAYAVTPTRPLQDGMKISVVASDAAGNASAPGTATVDADAPLKPTVNPTNGNLISGTAEGGSVVTITDDTGRLIGSTTAAPGGTYSFRPATPPVHGTVLRVAATDAAGNTSPEAKATVDAVSPVAPVVNPTNGNTISGTAQPGSTVTVKDSAGALIGSTTADASGNYAIKPAVPPAHGTVLEVTSGDTAGNVSQPATVTVDSKAPNAPSIDPTHGDPITGRAEPGSVVTVKDGAGKLVGSATAGANGAYAITPAKPLDDGVKITAVATDAAGNASAPATATVDAVPPGRPTVSATNGSTISGTAEAGSIVTIKDSAGNLIGSTTALPGGTYSLTPATRPANGTELRVSAADAAGNTSPEAKATVDSAAPVAPTVKPTSGSSITGTAEAGSTVTVKDSAGNLVGSAVADAGGNYTVKPATAVKHDTALEVTATDAAGNSGPAASVTVDSKAPDVPTVKPTSGSTIAGTAEAGSVVTVRDSAGNLIGSATAGSNGEYSLTPAAPVPNGTQLRVVAADATGNISLPVTATVDSVAPVIAVAIVNDANNDGFINASEKKADVTVKVTLVSGAAVGDDISLTDGTHMASVKLTAADVANGFVDVSFPNPVEGAPIRVSAISQDLAGNASRPTVFDSAVLDTTAPATPATVSATDNVGAVQGALGDGGSTDDSTPTFAGSGAAQGDIVKVYDGAALLGSTAVKADGSWVFTPAGLGRGAHRITHTITDAAGNTSAASAPLGFAVDTSAVAVSVTKAGETRSGQQITTRPAGSTDDTMPTIVGTATAGAVVSIKEGSTVLASTTADAAGNWSLKLPVQAEGAHSYKATAVNAAGTSSETSFALTIDATPPAVPVIASISDDVGAVQGALASGAASDDTRPTLSGSGATAGDIITVYDNGSAIGSTTVQSDGRWSFTTAAPTAPLGEGEHKLTVTATDPVGNQSQHSAPFVINVDTTAPARPAAVAGYVDSAGAVQDPASVAPFTDDTTPGFKIASVAAGLTPSLYVDGNKVAATYDANTGTLTPVSPLGEGAHSISYTLTDAAGNESPRANDFRLTVDLTPPSPPDASSIKVLDNVGAVQGPLAAGAKTDDSKPEYTGKADPAQVSAINVYDNGALIGSTAVNADGSWRFTPDLPLALGAHSLTARAVDAAGNIGAATPASTFTLVGDPPAAPAIIGVSDDRGSVTGNVPRDASTDDTALTLSGTGTVGTVVTVYADGVAVGSTSVAPNGTWSVTTSALSGDGVKNLSAEAVDGAGQASPRTGLYAVMLDTTAPPTPGTVIATDDQGPVQGAIVAGTTTDDTTPTFGGSGVKAGDTVRLYDGGALIGSITAATDGAWSITPSTPLGRGSHRITHTVTDAAGNTSAASAALDFTVDPTDVVVSIEQVADDQGSIKGNLAPGARTDDTTPTLVGKATAGAVVTVKEGSTVLGSTTADAGGNWRLTLPAQGEGTHSYTATAVNAAGKNGDATITLAIDTSAPDVPAVTGASDDVGLVQGAIANGGFTDDTTPTITGSGATPGDVIKVYDNGSALGSTTVKADGSWSFTPTTPLTEGPHGLRVTAIDPVGNESPQSGSFTVNVDTTPPTTKATLAAIGDDTGSSSADFVTSDRTLVLTVKVDSAMEAGARVQVSLDNGRTWNDATATGGGSYQYDNTGAALADGSYTFLARVVDAAGNVTPANSQLVVVDNSAPTTGNAVAITAYIDDLAPNTGEYGSGTRTNDTTPVLKGTVSGLKDGDVVQIHEGTTLLGTATVNGSAWTFAVPALTATGTHTYTASIADAAGNKGTTSGDFSLTLSSNPPQQAVTIAAYHDDAGLKKGDFGDGTSTDDTTPELRGTLSAAIGATDVVRIYEGSTLLGTATVNGTQWSFALPTLADGSRHTYVARIADAAGNEGTASPAFTLSVDISAPPATAAITSYIDDHDPQQGTFTSGSSTNDTTPLLNGTVTGTLGAGEVVAVYRGGVRLGEATMTGTSTWSYQDAGLVDGTSYSYTVRVEDAAGNGGAASPAFTLTVDLSAPTTAPSIDGATDDAAPTTGAIAPNGTTNDNRPELKGAGAQPSGIVRVYDNDKLIGSTTADSAGKWSFTPEAGKELADGMHSLKASNVDAAGNEGPKSAALEFGIDTVAPSQSATIVSVNDDFGAKQGTVADKGHTDDTAPQVTGTISAALKDGEKVVVLRDGAVIGTATVTNGTSWSFDDAGLSDGRTYTYTVRVEDAGGNRGAISAGYTLTVDTSVPPQTATITTVFDDADPVRGDVANGGTTNDSQPELRGALTAGLGATEVVAVYRDGTKIGTALVSGTSWSYTDTSGLANATSYSYTVRVEDAAGNAGAASSPYVVKLQLSGPGTRTTITAVVDDVDPQQGSVVNDGYTNDTAPQVQGEISAGLQAGEKVAVLRDGKVVGFATMKDATHWTYDDTGLAAGTTYTYTARVQDAASNPGADSNAHAVRVDTSRPAHKVTITRAVDNVDPVSGDIAPNGVTNDDTPTLEGTLSAPLSGTEQLQVFRNGLHAGTAKVTGTSWSFEDAGLASGSTYTYEARVMDAAGNAGDASNSLKFTVNTSGVAQTVQILQVQDNADPAQGKVADGGTTNDTTPTLSGSVSSVLNAGEVVEILRNDVAVGNATVSGTTWSFTDTGLADGTTYRYTARVVNSGGNQGAKSAAYAITLDTTPPGQSVAITSYTDDKAAQEGNFASGSTTNDVSPLLNGTFTGTLGATEVVAVYRNGTRLGTATMTGASTWTFQESGLADGNRYSYTARVEDAAGNQGAASSVFTIDVDTVAPPVATLGLGNYADSFPAAGTVAANQSSDHYSNDNSFDLVLAGADASTPSYEISTDGGANWRATTASQNNLSDGKYLFRAVLTDAAGNSTAAANTVAVTVDRSAPALDVQRFGSTLVAGTTEAGALVTIDVGNNGSVDASVTADANGNWSWTSPTPIAANTVVSAVAYDLAGNASSKDTQLIDTTPPAVTIDKSDGTVFSGTTSDADTPDISPSPTKPITVTLNVDTDADGRVDYVMATKAIVTADGSWTIDTRQAPVSVGAIVTAVAEDANGNRSAPATVTVGGGTSKISGKAQYDNFGYDVQAIGDFNGDGYNDFAVVAPHGSAADRRENAWSVNILYGSKQGLPDLNNVAYLPGTDGLKIFTSGSISDANILSTVQGYGDVNGDGYSDVIVYDDNLNSDWVIFGRSSAGATATPVNVDVRTIISSGGNSDGVAIVQREGSTWFGAGGALADVNGDGYADIIMQDWNQGVGASGTAILYGHAGAAGSREWANYYVGFNGTASPGSYVSDSRDSAQESSRPHTLIYNDLKHPHPANVMSIGDINGDGYADFAYSLFDARNVEGGNYLDYAGAIQVIYGSAKGFPQDYSLQTDYTNTVNGFRVYGEEAYQFLGTHIDLEPYGYRSNTGMPTSSGDVNGDGITDMIIGSPQFGPDAGEQRGPGRVYVVYGKNGGATSNIDLAHLSPSDGFVITASDSTRDAMFGNGTSVGDFNGDGIDDIAIGAPLADVDGKINNGAVYIVYGKQSGYTGKVSVAATYSGSQSANSQDVIHHQVGGTNSGSMLGVNVALSDLNGDGMADLALGSPYQGEAWAPAAGYLEVVYSDAFNFTNRFTVGDDVIAATASNDRLSGGAGNDVITGVQAGDSAYGGAGNDRIHVNAIDGVVRVDGGLGIDTLVVDGSNVTLDLPKLGLKVKGFENFDLGTGAANTGNVLKLRVSDVLGQQSSTGPGSGAGQGHLRVMGDGGDTVQLAHGSDSWSYTGSTSVGGVNYGIYHNSTLAASNTLGDVWIQQGVRVMGDTSSVIPKPKLMPQVVTIDSYTDDQDPQQGSFASGSTTNDATPRLNGTLTGQLDPGQVVAIYRDGARVGAATVSGATWTFDDSGLADGRTYSYIARAEDVTGNLGAASSTFTFVIDRTAPTAAPSFDSVMDDVGPVTAAIAAGGTTDDTRPEFRGSGAEPNGTVRIYDNGALIGTATANGSGQWSFTPAPGKELGNGAHSFTASSVDAAGNESPKSTPMAFTVDGSTPSKTATIDGYIDDVGAAKGTFGSGTTTDDGNPVLTGTLRTALVAGETLRIYEGSTLLGTATVSGTGWTYDLGNLRDGTTHSYKAAVVSAAGIEGTASNSFTLSVDYAVTVNRQTTVDTTPMITGDMPFKLANGEYIEVTVAGKTYSSANGAVVVDPRNNTWYVQVPSAVTLGTHDVRAVVRSASGVQIAADDTSDELIVSAAPTVTVGSAASDPNQKGTAYTIGENGMWRIHTNQTMLDANGTDGASLGSFRQTALLSNTNDPTSVGYNPGYAGRNYVQSATFMDFNRDGHMDLFAEDSTYDDGQQAFLFDGSSYTAKQVGAPSTVYGDKLSMGSANTYSWYGGVVAFDKTGDGFVDLAYGDQTPNDSTSGGGYDSQIVLNEDGTILGMVKDEGYTDDRVAVPGPAYSSNYYNATFDMELSGVDLDNDGSVDLVYHATAGVTKIGGPFADPAQASTPRSADPYRLVVASNKGDGTWENTQIIEKTFQRADDDPSVGNGISMTWADFNGDGYMDLFMSRGYGTTYNEQTQSRILFNDGTGKLAMNPSRDIGIGSSPSDVHNLFDVVFNFRTVPATADRLSGGPSLAVDWNADGKMDAIELPGFGITGGMTPNGASGPINLYTNTSSGGRASFATTNLLGGQNQIGIWTGDPLTSNSVTGAIAADIDWDGDRDLLAFTQRGNTKFIANTNEVADGTSMHFRIFDAQGINALYGNTVQLFDSKGRKVATQIINAQSGNQTNDSSAIVDFYGLDAKETYTLALLRNVNGAAADVGGLGNLGGNAIENVNAAWTGLKAGEANHAFVLTAESATNVANADIGNGIVGTGYNDTFFATLGNDRYEGGGGAVTVSGVRAWSSTGGLDVVDYKLAGSTPLTIDLGNTGAQNTGFGTATFKNVEGLAGGSGADSFTDNAADNQFEGRGGNDSFNLAGGGRDTLLYKLLAATDATGGNGADTVRSFELGTFEATANADRIELKDLLVGYVADADGAARYINGVATIDAGESIGNYLSVTTSGGNTTLHIDRDGAGGAYSSTALVTLNGVTTDLATLLANHQLVLA